MALQSVLNFIAEQQKYCHTREEEDHTVDTSKDCYLNEKDCTETTLGSGSCEKLQRTENFSKCLETHTGISKDDTLGPVPEEEETDLTKDGVEVAESLASSLSTPDTVVGAAKISSPHKIKPESGLLSF